MPLTPGSRVGPYEIIGALGAGGMGEVYRARDTKLNRDVAIKVLPELFAQDADRLARFSREAQTLAALNHSNIAAIYGIEESGGTRALVMELVEGDDLSQRIDQGALPLADALDIAAQIADGLEAAHDAGIIHRDLKPANIKVRPDGTVKILDFGLAKAVEPGTSGIVDPSNSPTLTARATQMGMVIGTAAYMAPEQARGKSVDRRADIWAFGVVLYEMLTGQRAFAGDEISDVLAAVLRQDIDLTTLPPNVPPSVRRLLRRCLEKDPRKRLSAMGDARLELTEQNETGRAEAPATAAASRARTMTTALVSAGVTALIAGAVWLWLGIGTAAPVAVSRVTILPPDEHTLYPDAAESRISPDGQWIAMVTGDTSALSNSSLWIRPINSLVARRVEGGDGAHLPFWSPDSQQLGFFADQKMKTVPVNGGRVTIVCDAQSGRGAAWSPDGTIVFAPDGAGPLYKVAAGGGAPTAVTALDATLNETGHRFPDFLPDGEHFVYVALPGRGGLLDAFIGSTKGSVRESLGSFESGPAFAPSGWLVFARQGGLAAQTFDPISRKLSGEIVTLDDAPGSSNDPATSWTGGKAVSFSNTGTLAYLKDPSANTRALWIDASGRVGDALTLARGFYLQVAISPDATRAVLVRQTSQMESSLQLLDLARSTLVPISAGRGTSSSPVWSPDGTQVVFASNREGPNDLFIKDVTSGTPEQSFYKAASPFKVPNSWSPDGQHLVFNQLDPGTFQNLWSVTTSGERTAQVVVDTPGRDVNGIVSPDGRWIAYATDDSNGLNVYVRPFPGPGPAVGITTDGGLQAWWRRDGKQIVVLNDQRTKLLVADVDGGGPSFRAGPPRLLATLPKDVVAIDAMPDLTRFLALIPESTVATRTVTLLTNWTATLTARAGAQGR